jgi:hypothetical protein
LAFRHAFSDFNEIARREHLTDVRVTRPRFSPTRRLVPMTRKIDIDNFLDDRETLRAYRVVAAYLALLSIEALPAK